MKRLVLSILIIAVIAVAGIATIFLIHAQNQQLYGKLDMVVQRYENGEDVSASLGELEDFSKRYVKRLSFFTNEELLGDLYEAVITLKTLYYDSSEEFRTECERIRLLADKIYSREVPNIGQIL